MNDVQELNRATQATPDAAALLKRYASPRPSLPARLMRSTSGI